MASSITGLIVAVKSDLTTEVEASPLRLGPCIWHHVSLAQFDVIGYKDPGGSLRSQNNLGINSLVYVFKRGPSFHFPAMLVGITINFVKRLITSYDQTTQHAWRLAQPDT
ncbi:hypothetical protein RvY_01757 [Ramazzottius varieornatus]|uniref:Uncharacterized protein n=1 Tax=Ramazzottius varieornatus TaxID=947166 RepID=A0A1D1UHL8_RAMVA|nr:hypothetical protein RvY_01757 [Ramazzottius varieornatus]